MTFLDTLLGRKPVTAVTVVEPPAVKAVTGAGVYALEHSIPIHSGRTDTARFMKRAQEIGHWGWVAVAERIVSGKLATIGWHVEDAEGEDITDTAAVAEVRRLIERPNPRMTRRVLWQTTSRHLGVCGNAFWYLDQRTALTGVPLQVFYINPARMTPATDKAGNLTGWLLDADTDYAWGRGVPLQLEEVLHFVYEPPDWGHMGHGLVEAAIAKIEIAKHGDRYLDHELLTGGKRGGMAGPKEGLLPDEVFQSLANNFRSIGLGDDKRTVVTQGAVDYTFTSSTAAELEISKVLPMTRDDILGIWGVPLSQTGIMAARGLNSGETVKYEEAALWQGAIHTRVVAMWETIQYQLLDRINPDWQLVLEEPTFDDQEPLFKLADLAKTQPLTNKERRDLLGLPPLGDKETDPRNDEVWLPKGFVRIYPEPEEPAPEAAPSLAPTGPSEATLDDDENEAEDDAEEASRKASLGPLARVRSKVEQEATPAIAKAVGRFLARARDEAVRYAAHMARKPTDKSMRLGKDWDAELAKVLIPRVTDIATEVAGEVRRVIPQAKKADPFEEAAAQFVKERGGERITGINGTTRTAVLDSVQEVIETAVAEGLSPDEAADLLTERVKSLPVWSEARADLIARTETMFAYNDAALRSYQDLEVTHVTALDGDKDAACSDRNGKVFTVDDAFSIADHPNGTLDWAPVV